MEKSKQRGHAWLAACMVAAAAPLLAGALTGCLMVGVGYSSRGGWFVWPGGLGFLFLLLLVLFLLRRRR